MHPGRRVCYKFENEITRKKGIPARYSYGTIRSVWQGHATVVFEDVEPPYLPSASIPIPCLAPDDDPDNPVGFRGLSYEEWWNRHRTMTTDEKWEALWANDGGRYHPHISARAALVERAEKRFGPRAYWKRPTRNWYRRNGYPMPAHLAV